jgi:predicted DNA repair protein MutK
MASGSLLALLDDIATILDDVALMTKVTAKKSVAMADDVATMTKVAAQKTAGVLGDDLALNAQQVTGVRADREIPVVWAVAKGSLINKLILVPTALLISAFAPWAVTPLLMVGGAFLCFEGFEKLAHKFLHSKEQTAVAHESRAQANADPAIDLVAFEKDKVQGAVRTDFILSAEIIAITLGTVAAAPMTEQMAVLASIAILMTIGVYGLVAGIVKLDDLGLWLSQRASSAARALGRGMVRATPWLMKSLSLIGTAAMFLVGGGILVHGVPALHHAVEAAGTAVAQWPVGGLWAVLVPNVVNGVIGIVAGALVLVGVMLVQRLRGKTGVAVSQ